MRPGCEWQVGATGRLRPSLVYCGRPASGGPWCAAHTTEVGAVADLIDCDEHAPVVAHSPRLAARARVTGGCPVCALGTTRADPGLDNVLPLDGPVEATTAELVPAWAGPAQLRLAVECAAESTRRHDPSLSRVRWECRRLPGGDFLLTATAPVPVDDPAATRPPLPRSTVS